MKKILLFVSILALGLCLSSCGDDEPVIVPETDPQPNANFTTVIDGKTVSFTNTSSDGRSYAWDFGDGNMSTEENATHTYEKNGSYIAKLTTTNNTGTDSKQEVLEIINISIDGDFADWGSVNTLIPDPSGTLTTIKIENLDNNKLFIYAEGNADYTPLTQIMLNIDNDVATGAQIEWRYVRPGEDILIEGSLAAGDEQAGAIYTCSPCDGSMPGEWNWGATPLTENIADFMVASAMMPVGDGFAFEMSIDLTALGLTISDEGIGIGFLDMSTETWDAVGAAPKFFNENDNPEGTLFSYSFTE